MNAAAPSASPSVDETKFRYEPSPDHPGWMTWELHDRERFNSVLGPLIVRAEGRGARVRMFPQQIHTNLSDNVHGATIMAFIDIAMFAASRMSGILSAGAAVTLDCATQFLGPAKPGQAMDAAVEVLRETGRLIFVRGLIEQGDETCAAFSGTLRKTTPSKPAG